MSFRSLFVSCVVVLSSCAFVDQFVPRRAAQGTIAFGVSDARAPLSGTITLRGLDRTGGTRIVLQPSEGRIARVPAGIYSVQWSPAAALETEPVHAAPVPGVIVVAPERVTTLRVRSEVSAADDARLAAVEVP